METSKKRGKSISPAVQSPGKTPKRLIQEACEHHQAGRLDDAEASYRYALGLYPKLVNAHMNLATILKETGKFDEAVEHYRQALAIKPDFPQAYFHLAHMRSYIPSTDEINAMKLLYSQQDTDVNQRVYLAFGLGSALDKHGAYDEAFEYFQAGHQLKKQSKPFDLARREGFFKSLMDIFDEDFLIKNQAVGPGDDMPIFIFGMPRSGTTLAEQILVSHPGVQGAGELSYVEDVVRQAVKLTGNPFPIGCRNMGAGEIHDLGTHYLEKLKAHANGSMYVTDTTPMNFRYVGLIATILPGARLVHCVRNPMDTCLSIFQQPLADSHAYANDLTDLGGFYQLYRELMDHWQVVLPGRIYNLSYEDLVTDSETEIRKLLDYCSLPFHKDCLAFHKTERSVQTPSASQVRQPIYTASIGRWKCYDTQLAPLKAVLK